MGGNAIPPRALKHKSRPPRNTSPAIELVKHTSRWTRTPWNSTKPHLNRPTTHTPPSPRRAKRTSPSPPSCSACPPAANTASPAHLLPPWYWIANPHRSAYRGGRADTGDVAGFTRTGRALLDECRRNLAQRARNDPVRAQLGGLLAREIEEAARRCEVTSGKVSFGWPVDVFGGSGAHKGKVDAVSAGGRGQRGVAGGV